MNQFELFMSVIVKMYVIYHLYHAWPFFFSYIEKFLGKYNIKYENTEYTSKTGLIQALPNHRPTKMSLKGKQLM